MSISDDEVEAALARWFIGEDISDCTEEQLQQFRADMRATLLAAQAVPKTINCDYPSCMCMIKCDEIHDNVAYKPRPAAIQAKVDGDNDQEVEAAAKALYEDDDVWNVAFPWPNLAEGQTSADTYRRLASAALSAASKVRVSEDREVAIGQAWDFFMPSIQAVKREKGLAGIWSTGFRSGWDAKVRAIREGDGDNLRKMHPISDEGLKAIAGKKFGINDPDLCAELAEELLTLRAAKEGN